MKEGKFEIEKPTTSKKIISTLDKLKEFKAKEEEAIKEDALLHSKSWEHINPDLLIKSCQELFELYTIDTLESLSEALSHLPVIEQEINKIKNKEERDSNLDFYHWIDDKIRAKHKLESEKADTAN